MTGNEMRLVADDDDDSGGDVFLLCGVNNHGRQLDAILVGGN